VISYFDPEFCTMSYSVEKQFMYAVSREDYEALKVLMVQEKRDRAAMNRIISRMTRCTCGDDIMYEHRDLEAARPTARIRRVTKDFKLLTVAGVFLICLIYRYVSARSSKAGSITSV